MCAPPRFHVQAGINACSAWSSRAFFGALKISMYLSSVNAEIGQQRSQHEQRR
jgi:hypothetical protein